MSMNETAVAKLPLPPRRVCVRRWGGILGRCCFTLLLLPHAAVGLSLLAAAGGMAALWAYAAPAAMLSGKRVLLESLLAVIWLAFDVFFLCVIWGDVYREWVLVARGAAAVDRIRDKQIRRGAFSTAYEVYFPTPAGLASMQTSAKLYAAFPNQSEVTILYDPRKPARAIVYELSRFKAA
jgi:hypothetical protein